jgi:diguanylate cyclase (GGDEF)-like protein
VNHPVSPSPQGQKIIKREKNTVTRALATPDRQDQSTTHYVAFSSQDNCLIPCWHQHQTIRHAVASCVRNIDDTVKAFTDGRERPLTAEEQDLLRKALLELYVGERELADRDDITGVLNRRAFIKAVMSESIRSRRSRRPLTVAYIDLDRFKKVNDTLGHNIGNMALETVACTMKSTLRDTDSVSRLHGDEYALLLPETNQENAKVVIEKLRTALKSEMKAKGWKITFSIGVVTFRNPANENYMLDQADKVMLSVKKTGKNRVAYLTLDGNDSPFLTREMKP